VYFRQQVNVLTHKENNIENHFKYLQMTSLFKPTGFHIYWPTKCGFSDAYHCERWFEQKYQKTISAMIHLLW